MALTALAAVFNVFSSPISQLFSDIWELDRNIQLLKDELDRLKQRLLQRKETWEYQQRRLSPLVEEYLEWTNNALEKAEALKVDANRQRERCFSCGVFCSPKIPTEIRNLRTTCADHFQRLDFLDTDVRSARHQPGLLLQPLPDFGLEYIEAPQQQLWTWLNEPHPQGRVIGVWGMAGVGKTTLLRLIYNNCQKKVSTSFDLVILHTISQNFKIDSLQEAIAESLKLKFEPSDSTDMRRMKLYASLKNKRFLLVLDDLWSPIDLNEVGVNFGRDKNSRVLISSRYRHVVEIMAEKEYCRMIRPLSEDEGWELFQKTAFKSGAVQDKSLQDIARKVARECKGLPLAINTVAAAIARKKTAEEWSRALVLMKNADPSFPSTHPTIDKELYQRLRWSYDDLSDHGLQMCFLYCAAFPEDEKIDVERLVEMWRAESLFLQRGETYFMDVGRECIQALVDRCLIEYVDAEKSEIKVHDVLRDMAIYVGHRENCLFQAGQDLKHFPSEEDTRDCKRISVFGNKISYLPTHLKCPTLVSLLLANNRLLNEIPAGFWVNFMSLKVLDLSYSSIKKLPATVGQLGKLEFLNLCGCDQLEDLPYSICELSQLQFLNLEECASLSVLPDRIGELKKLKHLAVRGVRVIPHQISQLTSLKKLVLHPESTPMCLEDLTNLSNLIELDVTVKPEIKGGSMSKWSKMRKLTLRFEWGEDEKREDAALDILPQNMQSMEELQSLELFGYQGVSLPTCNANTMPQLHSLLISDCGGLKTLRMEEFPDLQYIDIYKCPELEVEIGSLPMLKELRLARLRKAESIARPSSVWNSDTMPNLEVVQIRGCPLLRRMPREMEKLPKLKEIVGELDWWEGISWENDNVKSELSHLFRAVTDPYRFILFGDEEQSDEDIESEVAECNEDSQFEERERGGEDDHQD